MKNTDGATYLFTSNRFIWANNDVAKFPAGAWLPPRGPNGGMMVIRSLAIHALLNVTVADAVLPGEDCARFVREVTVKTTGGADGRRIDGITGDSLRLINFAMLGADSVHEHIDLAIAATTDRKFTTTIPFSKPFAYDPDDTALPVDFYEETLISMATSANMTVGGATVTVISGYYYLVAECFEQMSVILPAVDMWKQIDLALVSSVDAEIDTGGRCQDAYLYIPGDAAAANGGQTLANLTAVAWKLTMPEALQKDPDLKHFYQRARGQNTSSFSTKGNPVHLDPFVSADAGTLRATAIKLTTGSRVTDGAERAKENFKLTISANLPDPARLLVRFTTRKVEAQRAAINRIHKVRGWRMKTRDKSRQDPASWPPLMREYMSEKALLA